MATLKHKPVWTVFVSNITYMCELDGEVTLLGCATSAMTELYSTVGNLPEGFEPPTVPFVKLSHKDQMFELPPENTEKTIVMLGENKNHEFAYAVRLPMNIAGKLWCIYQNHPDRDLLFGEQPLPS